MSHVHVVGAGLAGLAAAVRLARRSGFNVEVHEASKFAGGRCRSFDDKILGCRIDNGNHLILSGNRSVAGYLSEIGASDLLRPAPQASYPFVDLQTSERWKIRINPGLFPLWAFNAESRPPGVRAWDFVGILLRLLWVNSRATVAEAFGSFGPLYEKLVEPLSIAVLNTPPEYGSAKLLRQTLLETFGKGGRQCMPMFCPDGLSESLIEPALKFLRGNGCNIRFSHRVSKLRIEGKRVTSLEFRDESVLLSEGDSVILATPPSVIHDLAVPVLAPSEYQPIVNVHFKLSDSTVVESFPAILGVLGGTAQWLFCRGSVVSVTASAAQNLVDVEASRIAERTWEDVCQALGLSQDMPKYRVVKERRATFSQTPDGTGRRPLARSRYDNLFIAGDWTDTGLPATIEGAVRSGHLAAELAASR